MKGYRGYIIVHSPIHGFFIKDLSSAFFKTEGEAQALIDSLIAPFVDVSHETAYGSTVKLSNSIRVF